MKVFIENVGFLVLILVILYVVLKLFKEDKTEPKPVKNNEEKVVIRTSDETIDLWKTYATEINGLSKQYIDDLKWTCRVIVGISTFNQSERYFALRNNPIHYIGRGGGSVLNSINLKDQGVSKDHLSIVTIDNKYSICPITKREKVTFVVTETGLRELNKEINVIHMLKLQLGNKKANSENPYPTEITFYLVDELLNSKTRKKTETGTRTNFMSADTETLF